jgi:hypothetical protein
MTLRPIATVVLVTAAGAHAMADTLATQRERGDALVQHLRSQAPAEALTNTGVLKIRDGNGRRRQMPVTIATWPDGGGWKVRYEARPASNGPVETLIVAFSTNRPPAYQAHPTSTMVPPSQQPFAGTDFWWCDLGLEFLHWPDQRVVKQEMSNGRLCWALDSYNPVTNGYASVRSWVDAEFNALLRAEAYDAQRRKVKEFSTGTFREVKSRSGGAVWMLRDIRMRDDLKDSRTELLYDLPK